MGGLAEPGFQREDAEIASDKRMSKATVWRRVFEELHEERGIDFRHHFVGVSDTALSGQVICMPAFSSLDANTQHGKLWILGTPLFEKYYTRWQWGAHEEKPKISFLKKDLCKACMGHALTSKVTADEGNHQKEESKERKLEAPELEAPKGKDYEKSKHLGNDSKEVELTKPSDADVALSSDSAQKTSPASLLQENEVEQRAFHRQIKVEDIKFPH